LPDESRKEEKQKLEKHLSLKLALASGILMICLLLFANLLNGFLAGKLESGEENLVTINNQVAHIEKLSNEKNSLKANIHLVTGLKGKNRNKYSSLLEEISDLVNSSTCLLSLSIKEEGKKKIMLEISGCAYSQSDVAEMMHNMETSGSFSEISLGNSEFVESRFINSSISLPVKNAVKFNLIANYNAD
jgi:Tfp pilus assembly protein PilN